MTFRMSTKLLRTRTALSALTALTALPICPCARLTAQDKPLRAVLMGEPRPGQDAPDFSAPYLTAAGPGPADQPFHLQSELGRRVALLFAGSVTQEAEARAWDALVTVRDSLFPPGTVVVGVTPDAAGPLQTFVAARSLPFKFLPDPKGEIRRRYGVDRGTLQHAWTVYLVTDEGRVSYRSGGFRMEDPEEVGRLRGQLAKR